MSYIPVITLAYLIILFLIAYLGDRAKEKGKSLVSNPYIYSLSLAVYCTAWTFYGSVGLFMHHGFAYMPIYIGPTFASFTWWYSLRKMVKISKKHNTTSIADFISTRYGKSSLLAGIISFFIFIGLLPYIALQIKAVTNSLNLLYFYKSSFKAVSIGGFYKDLSFYIAVILAIFGALFGARKLDVTEKHEGMVLAISFEAIVKLVAFLVVGIYVTYFIFNGYGDIFRSGEYFKEIKNLYTIGESPTPSYFQWLAMMILSGVAVMLLPRQFHIAIIENTNDNHIKKAMYIFPLYLFCISLFVPAIAIGGRLLGISLDSADISVLLIPAMRGEDFIAVLVFLGGFSAATGMVIVETVAISTMILNHIVSPFLLKLRLKKLDMSHLLIHLKRAIILFITVSGYIYFKLLGEEKILVDIGLMSFCAVLQLAPATFLGLYWEKVNKAGAIAGITAGFIIWLYVLFIPSFAGSFPFINEIIQKGLFNISALKPFELFYLKGLDNWSHSIFWSLTFNFIFLVIFSIISEQSEIEKEMAKSFISEGRVETRRVTLESKHISHSPSLVDYRGFLAKIIGDTQADKVIEGFISERGLKKDETISSKTALELREHVEKNLSAYLGSATAKNLLDNFLKIYGTKVVEIFDIFHDISESLKESRETLAVKVNEIKLLYSSLETLLSSLDKEVVMNNILDIIVKNFNADGCAVILKDKDGILRIKKHIGLKEEDVNKIEFECDSNTYVAKVFESRKIEVIEDVDKLAVPPKIKRLSDDTPIKSLTVAPIVVANVPLGVIVTVHKDKRFFSETFQNFLQGLANQLGLALKNAELYEELNKLNIDLENKVKERTIELERKSKLLEEANIHLKEVDRLKSQFLATMSHELRTPLNSIIGYTQLILDGVDGSITEEQRQDLERIEKNGKHLLQLINDILDLSKIEAGKMELNIEKVSLRELIDNIIPMVRPLIAEKKISFNIKIEKNVTVLADRQRLSQVLINLLTNSVKFTQEGFIEIGCTLKKDLINKTWAEIYVKDTGIGISKENQALIFEAFRQVDDKSAKKPKGTGLGLSITKRLVEMHGGSIWVESELNQGTTMFFTMPVSEEEFQSFVKEVSLFKGTEKRIVIVEEREDILQVLYDFLSKEGYTVFYSGFKDAIDEIKRKKPMAIVLDIIYSEENNWSILQKLKEDSETAKIPVIFISIEGDFQKGYSVGPIDYILKPIIKEDVIRELKKIEENIKNKFVYIVDDDADSIKLLEKILLEKNYKVKSFTNGKELIETLLIETPGVILLDLFMPEITGFEIIEILKKKELTDIPIIVITGGELTEEEKNKLLTDVKKIFIKASLDKDELLKEIKRSIERYEV
ncbi:MAG: ATP-binding protein [Proteobacteria bacterium]|nr:ATP-binding protein [Pseudomonadota bacterium]